MWRCSNTYFISVIIGMALVLGSFAADLLAQQKQELVVTIEPVSSSDKPDPFC